MICIEIDGVNCLTSFILNITLSSLIIALSISTENSEIRTSGRNHRKIFTIGLFKEILLKMDAIQLDDNQYEVSLENSLVEIVNGRGTTIPSRIKFNKNGD